MIWDLQPWRATPGPQTAREGESLHREENEVGRATLNKKSMVFHWLSPLPGKESLSSSSWAVLLSQVRAPPSSSQLYLIEVSSLLFFYISPLLIKIFL